jgi:uroporphyrinogen-III synthase
MGRLSGKRVVNTRAIHQAGELDDLLRRRGAVPLAYPCVAIVPPVDPGPLDDALRVLAAGGFAWLALTSANTVDALAQRGLDDTRCGGSSVAAVGPATASAARRLGLTIAIVPERYDGAAFAEAIPVRPGDRVLLPASEIADPELALGLTGRGAEVTTVPAYRTVVGAGGVDLPRLLTERRVDAVTLASASAVAGLVARLASEGCDSTLLNDVPLVCIGERTRRAALAHRLEWAVVAERATLEGLIETLERVLARHEDKGARWSRA